MKLCSIFCCEPWFLTGHELVPVYGLGVRNPYSRRPSWGSDPGVLRSREGSQPFVGMHVAGSQKEGSLHFNSEAQSLTRKGEARQSPRLRGHFLPRSLQVETPLPTAVLVHQAVVCGHQHHLRQSCCLVFQMELPLHLEPCETNFGLQAPEL